MLCQVPFDILKLDRYFISRIGEEKGETILKSTIALAKDLGMEIVAEGLESREQIAFLLRHGCRLGQGYYYARPLEKDRYFSVPGRRKTAAGGTTMREAVSEAGTPLSDLGLAVCPAFCG